MTARSRFCSAALLALSVAAFGDDASAPAAPKAEKEKAVKPPDARPAAPAVPAAAAAAAASVAYASPRSLDDALRILERRRADVDFAELPLADVVSFVSKVGRVNAMVAPALVLKAQGALPSVTLKLRNVSLRQLAELVAKTTGTALVLRDGVLQFTTPEDARGAPVLRVISIADLTFRVRNFPGPDIQLHTGGVRYVQEEETDQAQPFDDPQVVVDLIKKFTGEGTWEDEDVSISADGGKLVVKQYPKVLREIVRFLAVLRAAK